jgi:hypothetical protein
MESMENVSFNFSLEGFDFFWIVALAAWIAYQIKRSNDKDM